MIRGQCLCGGVKIEVDRVVGPFELCHCSRCRKVSGSAFLATVVVRRADFRFVQGQELVTVYDAPVLKRPPAYRSMFCKVCGAPVPDPAGTADEFEICAGIFDDAVGAHPDKHIFVDVKSDWYELDAKLPQLTEAEYEAIARR